MYIHTSTLPRVYILIFNPSLAEDQGSTRLATAGFTVWTGGGSMLCRVHQRDETSSWKTTVFKTTAASGRPIVDKPLAYSIMIQ
jgi:hypothetical protein